MIKEDEKNRIINLLNQRVEHFVCPICHKGHFSFVDGYSNNVLGDNYQEINLGGRILPYIMLVCDNCGFISQHALGTLGLINKSEKVEEKTEK